MAESKTGPRGGRGTYTLELVGLQPGAERPPVLVQAIDAKGGILHSEKVSEAGTFALPPEALKNARYVVIGAIEDEKTVAQAASVRFRPGEFEAALHACNHPIYKERYQHTKRRLGRQRGPKVAQIDLSRKLTEAIWHMLTRNQPFAPAGAAFRLAA